MQLTRRIPLLLALLGVAVIASWLALQEFENRRLQSLYRQISTGRSEQIRQALEQTGLPLRLFVNHHTAHRTFQRIQEVNPVLDRVLGDYLVTGVWIVRPDGTVETSHAPKSDDRLPPLPPPDQLGAALARAEGKPVHFFLRPPGGVPLEVYGRVSPVRTPADPPRWLLAAAAFDTHRLQDISFLSGTYSRVTAAHEEDMVKIAEERMHFHVPLPGVTGEAAAMLDADYRGPELIEIKRDVESYTWIFLAALVSLLSGMALGLRHWIVRPLQRLTSALETGQTAVLDPLDDRPDEFNRLAGLVRETFANREELQRTLDERARLGRDLHDGAIQSIYAAGMHLARARTLVRTQPEESERIINGTRESLNSTIAELRDFINHTEYEPLSERSFADVTHDVLQQLQPDGVRVQFAIDERLPAGRRVEERLEALQIIREASSNALRHGGATELTVLWQPAPGGGSCLEIADNGCGFTPAPDGAGTGRGLANMAERARVLGGTLQVDSRPGGVTTIRVVLPASPTP